MSQLKKQTIVSRKGARTPQKRKASNNSSVRIGLFRMCLSTSKALFAFLYRPIADTRIRWSTRTVAPALAIVAAGFIAYSTPDLLKNITEQVPERLEVRCLRIDLREKISEIASDTLNQAQKGNWTRTALMDKLMSRISKLDGVDVVRIRAGLDRRVLVDVTAQTPFLVLRGKGSEKVLVGDQFKIIARSLPNSSYDHLPQIEAPELALNLSVGGETSETHPGYFVRPSINAGVNVRWLSQQTINIYSLFESERIPLKVEKVIWKSVSGFNVEVEEKLNIGASRVPSVNLPGVVSTQPLPSEDSNKSHSFNVVLGESGFKEKFSRLKQVVDDLRSKKTVVDQIDLGYSDKAIIKINEQLSELKRGGL